MWFAPQLKENNSFIRHHNCKGDTVNTHSVACAPPCRLTSESEPGTFILCLTVKDHFLNSMSCMACERRPEPGLPQICHRKNAISFDILVISNELASCVRRQFVQSDCFGASYVCIRLYAPFLRYHDCRNGTQHILRTERTPINL